LSVAIAIVVIGIIVLIHEIGHFTAARKAGVVVEEFAVGMGPKLLKWKPGETLYSLRLFPIGGFCKMLGDEGVSRDSRAFGNKSLPRRIAVISAGAILNFILAFVLFLILMTLNGFAEPVIRSVVNGFPAEQAGLRPGDRILDINGSKIVIYEDISFVMFGNKGEPIDMTLQRGDERISVTLTPRFSKTDESYKIGFSPNGKAGVFENNSDYASAGLGSCVFNAFYRIIFFVKTAVLSVVMFITRQVPINNMSGMIGMAGMISEAYTESINATESVKTNIYLTVMTMINFCAIFSANLGAFNLLPLPALDGGRLVFLFVEGVRRKPVPPEREGLVHMIGFVALMILAAFLVFNDIRKML